MNTIQSLAEDLGVSVDVLKQLGVKRNGSAWHIPERDADGQVVGHAKRFDDGGKGFVEGGHRGLTLAWPLGQYEGLSLEDPVLIVEGMSDTAAGMRLGFTTVGRPSAKGGAVHLAGLLKDRHVAVVGERDEGVGHTGAHAIAQKLIPACASVRVIFPPEGVKDLREWSHTCTRDDILQALEEKDVLQSGADTPQKQGPRKLIMRMGHTIDDAGTEYLWPRRLVMNSLNLIFSRPGRGKSTLAADLIGHVTTGKPWPDGLPCEKGTCLYIKGEGTDRSVNDRLRLAGADLTKCGIISKATGAGDEMIDLATDAERVADLIDLHPDTRLVIIDTLDSMFPSMRMIDNTRIRQCLWPLQDLAEKWDVCVVLLAHTNKGGHVDPIDRLSGARAISGAARTLWYLGKLDPEDPKCYMTPVKVNDFLPAPTLEYQIEGHGPDQPGVISWGDVREDVTPWKLDQPQKAGQGSKAERCHAWLAELLAEGPVKASDAKCEAKDMSFGGRVMAGAKTYMKVKTLAAKGVSPPVYYLCLPDQSPPDLSPKKEPAHAPNPSDS